MATNTMVTKEIARNEWPEFFDAFSRRHEGWLVTVEVFGELGAQIESENQALKGIVAERRDDSMEIEILTGNAPEETLTHIITRPTKVWIEETREGAEAALEIESEEHGTTLVRFRSTVLPEAVDGVAREP
jgi:Family of unknown function (DUF5335)